MAGHWIVLPAERVLHLPKLQLSPIGVVPQRDRRPRTIIDYSFNGVNQDTVRLAPASMQFGRALHRVLQKVRQADRRHGPVFLSKIDMADAYMRVPLQIGSVAMLGALLPKHRNEPPMVAFPLVLPMGWVESPPYFCTVSETITDLTNQALQERPLPERPHRLETAANSALPRQRLGPTDTCPDHSLPLKQERREGRRQPPLTYANVYMDDELAATQGDVHHWRRVRQTFLHAVDEVLRPLQDNDRPSRKEPVSVKKLKRGTPFGPRRRACSVGYWTPGGAPSTSPNTVDTALTSSFTVLLRHRHPRPSGSGGSSWASYAAWRPQFLQQRGSIPTFRSFSQPTRCSRPTHCCASPPQRTGHWITSIGWRARYAPDRLG